MAADGPPHQARVALATFCLTPYNVLLLDEPTNHLDVGAIQALLDALDTYEGAIVVISHDRPFCEAVRATHVGYVCSGRCVVEERELPCMQVLTTARSPLLTTARSPLPHRCVVEERELRDADFSETDRGVRNNFVGDASAVVVAAPAPPPMSAEEAKRLREEQRNAQKLQNGAPKKLARLEEQIGEAETAIAALDAEMMKAGSDVGRVRDLDAQRGALQAKLDGWYALD
jgi:ABC-type multidrug transport system ATPase subunit